MGQMSAPFVIDGLASVGPFYIAESKAPLTPSMLSAARASGIHAINLTILWDDEALFESTMWHLAYWERELSVHRDHLLKVLRYEDLITARQSGKVGLIFGFQDAAVFEGRIERIDLFANLGVRIVQLTYNAENDLGHGCASAGDTGLTSFGRQAVARINELRLLIDLSHCGTKTTLDAIEASSSPVSITHSGCRALVDHPRNKSDEVMRRLAERGGVFGVYFMPFLSGRPPASLEDVLDHIDHALNICGEDHVGIGSDQSTFPVVADAAYVSMLEEWGEVRRRTGQATPGENTPLMVEDLNSERRMFLLADALSKRGRSSRQIEKICGDNFARLFRDVWDGK